MTDTPAKILWLDLEMTGLDPAKDRIVEVGALVTDWDFTDIASFESGVGQNPALLKKLFNDNPWAKEHPHNTRQLVGLSLKSPAEKAVQSELLHFITTHFGTNEAVLLAGNSIHQDRRFIKQWWPEIEQRLHYRMLDVSAWKVVMQGKYGLEFSKKEDHRALGDIRESVAELQFYLTKMRV